MNLDPREILFLRSAPEQARDLVCRALQIRASTLDEKARSVEVVLATETQAQVFDMRSWSIVDEVLRMDGCEIPAQVPLLADHNRYSIEAVRGSIRDIRVHEGKLIGRAVFADDADSERAWQKVRQGHLTDVSAGYRVAEATDIPPGESREVNGRKYTAGARTLRISTRWEPKEGSLVPIGADPNAKFRDDPTTPTHREAQPAPIKEPQMNPFKQWLSARGLAYESLTEAQRAALEADFRAEQARAAAAAPPAVAQPAVAPAAPAAPAAASEGERAAGIRAERERIAAIRGMAEGIDAAMVDRAISEGWDVGRASQEFLTAFRAARRPAAGAEGGEGSRQNAAPVEVICANEDKFVRAAENACAMRLGIAVPDAAQRAEAMHLRGIGLQDLARLALRAHRQEAPIGAEELLKRAISTYSFPTALGNTLHRSLVAGYEEAPSTILLWASEGEVKDFREHKSIKVGKFARPEKVGKGGEIKNGTIGEEAEGYSAETYGQAFALSRNDFINDDLGLFARAPLELGQNMKMNIDDIGYDLLISAAGVGPTMDADSVALFATSRSDGSNYYVNAAATLSSASLGVAKRMMRALKQNGRPLNLVPVALVVPPELEQTALELVAASTVVGSTTADVLKPNVNIHAGSLKVIVEPRLSAATNGATAWYLVCAPARARSIQVSFLRGQRNPTLERKDPANVLGMGWIAYHDVGVDAIDWRGIFRSKGAA